jgi:hypothetical protein
MKLFFFSAFTACALAAYAGDVANPGCDWTLTGYACTGEAVADSGGSTARG